MQSDYDGAAACVLDFFSGELVGSKHKKLHIVHHDDMTAFFKPWSNHYTL